MTISQAGQDAVAFILNQIDTGIIQLPNEIHLVRISDNIGASVQCIGSAFDDQIKPSLTAKGFITSKRGTPRRILLSRAEIASVGCAKRFTLHTVLN